VHDKDRYVAVCIDDFALKKRQRYGTIMVDLDTHRIVDLIPSRETSDVARWLKEYPNIAIVSRDGSNSYAAAISIAFPHAYQVSDRFHLIKNLIERATLYFQSIFKGRITIPATQSAQAQIQMLRSGTMNERAAMVKKMRKEGQTIATIHANTGIRLQTIRKYIALPEEQIINKKTVREKEHEEAIKKIQAKADWVRDLYSSGLSKYEISKQTGFTPHTVKGYLSENFTPVNGHYGKSREGKLASYRDIVLRMRAEGVTYQKIAEHIRGLGYNGSVAALRGFVTKEKRISADLRECCVEETELIDRKWVIQLLYRPLEKVKGITEEQYKTIIKIYPNVEVVYSIINKFKNALNSKETKYLFEWMDEVRTLAIPEFGTFIKGLEQDIDAVKNAVVFDCSNGLAEGSINKLKVIKRIMYGRCSFGLLRKKVIGWDRWKHFN